MPMPAPQYVGAPLASKSNDRLLRGTARFVADLRPGATLHAAFVRSDHACARIVAIDTTRAQAAPGVVAVLTGPELAEKVGPLVPPGNSTSHPDFTATFDVRAHPRRVPCLAVGEVRYVGEPVVVVVAADRHLAEDAAREIDVEYEPLAPVVTFEDAAAATSAVWADVPDNAAVRLAFRKGDLPADTSDLVVVEGTYRIARQTGMSIECRGVQAYPADDGRLAVWSSTQVPFIVRRALCAATGWDEAYVRVRSPEVGGGFGPKAVVYVEEIVVPYLAHALQRPVAWIEDRYENLTSAAQARDNVHHTRLTLDSDGHILAWEDDYRVDLGAYNLWMVGVVANTALHALGAYRIPAVRISGTGVFSNKTPTSQYRGAGRPEATFALERSLDAAARRLSIGGSKLRDINILGPDDLPYAQGMPYRDGVPIVYDGQNYRRVLHEALALVGDEEVAELKRSAGPDTRIGFGACTYVEATARGPFEPETARIVLEPGGGFEVSVGTGPSGQAHDTVFAQVAADTLGVGPQDVRVRTGDTDGVGQGLGSFASRSAVIAGSAVRLAAEDLVAQAGSRDWAEVAASRHGLPPLEATRSFAPETVTWTMGAHAAVVAVDTGTGAVEVLRYAVAHEAGPALNPRIVDGQVRGGVAQGIGGALLEHVDHAPDGQPLSATLADYRIPETTDIPAVRLGHIEVPSTRNPLGIRGVGESGVIAGSAVLASAVDDALAEHDVHVTRTPMTADYVLSLIPEAHS
jgi:carbon-monoxide dehydrogenase large subunit